MSSKIFISLVSRSKYIEQKKKGNQLNYFPLNSVNCLTKNSELFETW